MLNLRAPSFEAVGVDVDDLARVLGVLSGDLDPDLPIEKAVGDFVHLLVPVRSLDVMQAMTPDFGAIADFSRTNGVQTVCAFTREVRNPASSVHCRDFCPAVGTPESPAAGTTNAALTSYLVRHRLIDLERDGPTVVLSEQGYECGRPSQIRSEVTVADSLVERLVVGGSALKSIIGDIFLPAETD
jgi:PhzF family phenazine biosynthesis protein